MKILIIRHADPDYSVDSLTPQGRIEAELLSRRLSKLNFKAIYVSPLGRARHTADYTLKKIGQDATVCDWLQEFPVSINKPGEPDSIAWDWYPADWTAHDDFFHHEDWLKNPVMVEGKVEEQYRHVTEGLDKVLAAHGYERCGRYYKATAANEDTIAFFCHFGLECVLLSHLLNISPLQLWHGFCAAPSSVTTLITEERQEGKAYFRTAAFGDISHLYAGGEEPSFAARFCETFANTEQRH